MATPRLTFAELCGQNDFDCVKLILFAKQGGGEACTLLRTIDIYQRFDLCKADVGEYIQLTEDEHMYQIGIKTYTYEEISAMADQFDILAVTAADFKLFQSHLVELSVNYFNYKKLYKLLKEMAYAVII